MYKATPETFTKPEFYEHPIALLYCPECGTVNEWNDEAAKPGALCPGCGTDSPAFSFVRTYPSLRVKDNEELERLETIAAGSLKDV